MILRIYHINAPYSPAHPKSISHMRLLLDERIANQGLAATCYSWHSLPISRPLLIGSHFYHRDPAESYLPNRHHNKTTSALSDTPKVQKHLN
jgi:hypothetical protein